MRLARTAPPATAAEKQARVRDALAVLALATATHQPRKDRRCGPRCVRCSHAVRQATALLRGRL